MSGRKTIWSVIGRKRWVWAALVILLAILFWNCLPATLFDAPHSMALLDRNGNLRGASIAADEQWRFPPVPEVPPKFIQAITCFEDRRFFDHLGVDPLAVARAIWQNLRSGRIVSGARTITMPASVRPGTVVGAISPYPTGVSVTTAR